MKTTHFFFCSILCLATITAQESDDTTFFKCPKASTVAVKFPVKELAETENLAVFAFEIKLSDNFLVDHHFFADLPSKRDFNALINYIESDRDFRTSEKSAEQTRAIVDKYIMENPVDDEEESWTEFKIEVLEGRGERLRVTFGQDSSEYDELSEEVRISLVNNIDYSYGVPLLDAISPEFDVGYMVQMRNPWYQTRMENGDLSD